MRRVKNRGCPSYACWGGKGTGCTARKQEWVDAYVEDVIVARLEQPDVLDVFRADDTDAAAAAQREVAVLRAQWDALMAAGERGPDAGGLSVAAVARLEPPLLAKRADAERRAHPPTVPRYVADLAGDDARSRWEALTMPQRRQVIRTLCTVRIHRARRGVRTFDPSTVTVQWKG